MREIWKDIPGYDGEYQVSTLGRLRSFKKKGQYSVGLRNNPKILLQQRGRKGYLSIGLCHNGVRTEKKSHRLVAMAFIPNPDNKPQTNHKNGVVDDNRVSNLEWSTNKENVIHAYKFLGKQGPNGELHGCSKLKWTDITEIRQLHAVGALTQKDIAGAYNVSQANISDIVLNKTWTQI